MYDQSGVFYSESRLNIMKESKNIVGEGNREGSEKLGQGSEAPVRSEFLSLLRISEFFGFQWQKLAEILSLFKLYNNLGKVAVRVKLWLIIYCGHLVEWIVK